MDESTEKKIPEQDLEKLRAEHGEVWVLDTSQGPVALRAPTLIEVKQYRASYGDDPAKFTDALNALGAKVCVYPGKAAFEAMCSKRGGIAGKIANEALRIWNDEDTRLAKKAMPPSSEPAA